MPMPCSARADLHAQDARNRGPGARGERDAATVFLRLLARDDRGAHEAAAQSLQRLGRQRGDATRRERKLCPLVVEAERERSEDLTSQPARANAVARVAEPVMNARAGNGPEE